MLFFFFNDTATTEIYTLSLHDALPICLDEHGPLAVALEHDGVLVGAGDEVLARDGQRVADAELERLHLRDGRIGRRLRRSEEHTSELQSRQYLVCRLLLEKKKQLIHTI